MASAFKYVTLGTHWLQCCLWALLSVEPFRLMDSAFAIRLSVTCSIETMISSSSPTNPTYKLGMHSLSIKCKHDERWDLHRSKTRRTNRIWHLPGCPQWDVRVHPLTDARSLLINKSTSQNLIPCSLWKVCRWKMQTWSLHFNDPQGNNTVVTKPRLWNIGSFTLCNDLEIRSMPFQPGRNQKPLRACLHETCKP